MPEQSALIRGAGGIWHRYLTGSSINHGAWLRARSEHAPVGTCRTCGSDLMPLAPHDRGGGRFDYGAECQAPDCAGELVAPGGRVVRGTTTAWSESNGAARAEALHRAAKEARKR